MLHLLKSYHGLSKLFLTAIIAACALAPNLAMAFDSKSVLQMHIKIQSIQTEVSQIPTPDVAARERVQAIEQELNDLRARLQLFENNLAALEISNQLADGVVVQRPLEDPFAQAAPKQKNKIAQAAPNVKTDELNTVPEALRAAPNVVTPKPQAFAATELPEATSNLTNGALAGALGGSLGNQAADIVAFNEAKSYFDDAYYVLSERKFNQFIQYYRQSTLISNAYYWLGESYYMRKNYKAAARVFYQGYRVNKNGTKAPDSLFRLASILAQLGNKSDACASYIEIGRRYSESHPQLSSLAQSEREKQACL